MDNIEELNIRQADHENQIKKIEKKIQENDCHSKHLKSKIQT